VPRWVRWAPRVSCEDREGLGSVRRLERAKGAALEQTSRETTGRWGMPGVRVRVAPPFRITSKGGSLVQEGGPAVERAHLRRLCEGDNARSHLHRFQSPAGLLLLRGLLGEAVIEHRYGAWA